MAGSGGRCEEAQEEVCEGRRMRGRRASLRRGGWMRWFGLGWGQSKGATKERRSELDETSDVSAGNGTAKFFLGSRDRD